MTGITALAIAAAGAATLTAVAAWRLPIVHMGLSATIAGAIAYLSFADAKRAAVSGASPGAISGIHATSAGYILAWAAVALVATYTTALEWDEWWQFFAAFGIVGVLTLLLARTLVSDARKGKDDVAMIIIARFLAWWLLIGGAGAAIGLLADKKMTRFLSPRYTDWAANNTFFFGGIALAFLGWAILQASRKAKA